MKILIAADSFKDALDTFSVCQAIRRGLSAALPDAYIVELPLSDGGEGLSDIAAHYFDLQRIEVNIDDPLFRTHTGTYGLSHDNKTAFIEMAQAAGLQLLKNEERNPLKTTTYGVGQMIQHALDKGADRIIIGLGGSATNDAGIGMAAALGWHFLDYDGNVLSPVGENLINIQKVIPPQYFFKNVRFEAICDVKNPLFGKNGAAHIFARQKGATDADIETLDQGLKHFATLLDADATVQGAGAAGGLGFGCLFFLNAIIKRGIDSVLDWADFDSQVKQADWIFTGEGRLDKQTVGGKLISGITKRAQEKPVVALCGSVDLPPQYVAELGLKAVFSITPSPCSLAEALESTAQNLENTAYNIAKIMCDSSNDSQS